MRGRRLGDADRAASRTERLPRGVSSLKLMDHVLCKDGVSLVVCLFAECRPTTVARFVVPIVVDAIDGVLGRRALPHVGQKVLKDLPALADGDPAPAVVR